MKVLLYAIVVCLMLSIVAMGHSGGLDELGCHNDKREGNYHCHRGPLAGRKRGSAELVCNSAALFLKNGPQSSK